MFYDRAKIYLQAGDGGNGVVAFRREKYVPEGGPSGGDGGRGGDIIVVADSGLHTLADFKYRQHYRAERGGHGGGKNMRGKDGDSLTLKVPVGTIVRDAETGAVLADLVKQDQSFFAARGGRGGRGNARFATALNRVPGMAEKGEPGEARTMELELKVLADVGLVGFPNAGKSSLIASISQARPKIADYPFTTLTPNLGVVVLSDERIFVVADVPGLIEGAHAGAGLGHEFLRHVERTRVLVQVVDCAQVEGRDVVADYQAIRSELELYNPYLARRRTVVAANKMDLPAAGANLERLQKAVAPEHEVIAVSAATGQGLGSLVERLWVLVQEETLANAAPVAEEEHRVTVARPEERFRIERTAAGLVVSGAEVERHLAMTDLDNDEAVRRLQSIFKRMGIDAGLRRAGAEPGEPVFIGGAEFTFVD